MRSTCDRTLSDTHNAAKDVAGLVQVAVGKALSKDEIVERGERKQEEAHAALGEGDAGKEATKAGDHDGVDEQAEDTDEPAAAQRAAEERAEQELAHDESTNGGSAKEEPVRS